MSHHSMMKSQDRYPLSGRVLFLASKIDDKEAWEPADVVSYDPAGMYKLVDARGYVRHRVAEQVRVYTTLADILPQEKQEKSMAGNTRKNDVLAMGMAQIEHCIMECKAEAVQLFKEHCELWPAPPRMSSKTFNIIDNIYVETTFNGTLKFTISGTALVPASLGTPRQIVAQGDVVSILKAKLRTPRQLVRTRYRLNNVLAWLEARRKGLQAHNRKQLADQAKWVRDIQGHEAVRRESAAKSFNGTTPLSPDPPKVTSSQVKKAVEIMTDASGISPSDMDAAMKSIYNIARGLEP